MPRKPKKFNYTAQDLLIADFEYKRLVEESEKMLFKLQEIRDSVRSCNELYAYKEGLYRVIVETLETCGNTYSKYKILKIADKNEMITSIV